MARPTVILNSQAVTLVNENLAGEAIKPGHIVFLNSLSKFMKNTTGALGLQMQAAIEDDLRGKGTADAYASGDVCRAAVLRSGDRFNCRLAASQTLVVGDYIEMLTGGQLTKRSAGVPVAKALAAATSSTADDFLLVEVL